MSRFTYTARSSLGVVNGVQEAASASAVADILVSKGLTPLNIKQDGGGGGGSSSGGSTTSNAGGGLSSPVNLPGFLGPKVTPTDLMIFTRQIHTLLKAGVPILRALAGLHDTATNPAMKQTLFDLRRSLESGVELSSSMALNPKVFDNFYVSMVKVGESSGRLDEVFMRLFEHLEFETFMRQQVKSALRYPTFVITAMVGAIGVINVMVIPAFAGVFKALGAGLPLPTKILMATSNFTVNHGWLLLLMAAAAFFGFRMWIQTPQGRMIWHRSILKMPLVGNIVSKAALARFARAFALSLRSGVPLERALTGVAYTADNVFMSARIEALRDFVTRGEPLAHAAAASGIFTPIVLQMIAIGEETGMVDDLLEEVGELYGNEVEYALKTLSQQIEPILIIFLGVVVLVLALGVFLPMWDLGSAAMHKQ